MKEDSSSKENNLLFHVRDYLNQYVYAINRLDRPVSGIVLFSKKNEDVSDLQKSLASRHLQEKISRHVLGRNFYSR